MFHYKRDLFDFFPKHSILQHFCDEINQSSADVFILMAHKAVQLFQVLLDQEYIDESISQKTVISSQALDYDCQYLINKKIAIIDDIVISGTSIASAVHKLLAIGVGEDNIEIITLARDKKYQTMSFDNDNGSSALHCNTVLDDAACIELSYSISKAFSFYGIPYDIDYPTYSAINLHENKIQLLFNQLLWRTEISTNIDQQNGNVTPYILFPTQNVLEILWERIGADLSNCVHIKIRVYVRKYPSGRLECSIVPMCLFNELAEVDLERLYDVYAPSPQKIKLSCNRLLVSKMRYLEFYIAHQMYLVFNELTSFGAPLMPTEASIRLLFGYNDGEKVFAFINGAPPKSNKKISVNSVDYIDQDVLQEFLNHEIGREMANNIAKAQQLDVEAQNNWINHIILAPFLWWYDTKEIPVRKDVMFPVKHYIRDYQDIEKLPNRLRSGFSLRTVQYLLNEDLANEDTRIFVSLFLDHAIDSGIIVPAIYHNTSEHYLCRAYRHGEDLPFGLEDECRLVYFLHEICVRIPEIDISPNTEPSDNGLAEISFEKMIVLFYQMGIRQGGIFNRFLGFNNIKILKPFLSLHGAIQAFIDPQQMREWGIEKTHFYSEKDPSGNRYITWLTNWAKDQGFAWNPKDTNGNRTSDFLLDGKRIRQYLEKNERSCINDVIASRISDIASMIATWYNNMVKNGEKSKFKDEATALTSCSNAHIFVSAIATEIHYFDKFWLNEVNKAFYMSKDYDEIKYNLTNDEENSRNTANIIQGLNSGRNKVKWYYSNSAKEVVNRVSNILRDTGASNWIALWSSAKETPETTSPLLSSYIQQALSFLYFYSACNDCLTYTAFWQTGEKPPYYEDFQSEYNAKSNSVRNELGMNWFDELNEISVLEDFYEKKTRFYELVKQALHTSEDLVDNIEDEVDANARDYTISYISSLIFEVDALNPDCIEKKIMEVWKQQKDLEKKTQLNIFQFPQLSGTPSYKRYGIFYGIGSNYEGSLDANPIDHTEYGKVLLSIYQQLCQAFCGRAKGIRAIILPDTPVGRRFKHNAQKNITENVKKFAERVIQNLHSKYVENTTQQLVVALTDSVDPAFLKYVKSLNWKNQQDLSIDLSCRGFARIVVLYNEYIPLRNSSDFERIFYSTVVLHCGSKSGMGLLVTTNNRVVCVTCNHILEYYSEQDGNLIIAQTDSDISFRLRPLKEICIASNAEELIPAEKEIAILEPLWDTQIPYILNHIISINELNSNPDKCKGVECQCCGCVNNNDRVWNYPLRLIGRAGNGYYQIDDPQKILKNGCSGGVTIDITQKPTVIGIHKGRITDMENKNNKYPQLIPSTAIKDEITKMEETIK